MEVEKIWGGNTLYLMIGELCLELSLGQTVVATGEHLSFATAVDGTARSTFLIIGRRLK